MENEKRISKLKKNDQKLRTKVRKRKMKNEKLKKYVICSNIKN